MVTAHENTASVNDSTIELITSIQERIVDAQKEFAATVARLVPDVPSFVPQPDLPEEPDPKALVEQSFKFQAQLLQANRTFSLGLIDAWSQATPNPVAKGRPSNRK